MPLRRTFVAAALAGLAALAFGAPARAVTEHRAVVVVDTGAEVKIAKITFADDSISGLEALQRGGMDPVARAFAGNGGAVCSLCGKGCPADGSCLTCGGANYWSYFRAPVGAAKYTYSPVGAGSTRVRDGDVEAWKWGPGTPPPFVSFASVWGPPPTVAPTTTSAPVPGVTTAPADPPVSASDTVAPVVATEPDRSGGPVVDGAVPEPTSPVTNAPPPTGSTAARTPVSATTEATAAEARRVAVAPTVEGGATGGSWTGVAAAGAVAAALVVWIVVARHRRSRGTA